MQLNNLTFRGGVHFDGLKSLSNGADIQVMPSPDEVILPLSQHIGAPAKPLVKKGDHVLLGQKIAEAGGFVSAPVHASVSGEVTGIIDYRGSANSHITAIVIQNDHQDTPGYETVDRSHQEMTSQEIIDYIKEAGIVGMGGAGFPTHVKLLPPKDGKLETVIVNGSECEGYLTADDMLMRAEPDKVVLGMELLLKATGAEKAYIAIEDNKPKAIAALEKATAGHDRLHVATMKTKYPQGDERRLTEVITGQRLKAGALPSSVGCVICNVGTTCAIVDAVYYGKPLYERIVTVTGHGVNTPKNLKVRLGSSIRHLVEFSGGYASTPGKIILGGIMMGVSQYSDSVVIDKRNNGVIVLTQEEAKPLPIDPCIRCGRCVDVCPVFLEPLVLATASRVKNFDLAESFYVTQCIECGSCSYICPSHRPLVEWIRFGKREVMSRNRK